MVELSVHDKSIVYVFRFNGSQFYITLMSEELEGEGALVKEFNDFKRDIHDPEIMFEFEEWVLQALDEFMQGVAPTPARDARKPLTLLDYFSPPTYAFKLINKNGKLCAVREEFDPQLYGHTRPRTQIADSSEPRSGRAKTKSCSVMDFQGDRVLHRSSLPSVPILLASQLEQVDDGLRSEELDDIPKKVRRVDTGEVFFFKAGFVGHGQKREIDILSQIDRADNLEHPYRTSRLAGLVVWGDGDNSAILMGMLLAYIEGETLAERMEEESAAMRLKWYRQIQATVRRLHGLGIIWGDVKPDNVIINSDGDAVVVDFGGGYTPEYIAPELQETMQGDMLGLDHMAETMGIRHKSS